MKKVEVSFILPAFNESENLRQMVKRVERILKKYSVGYEIIISEDGSTDGTDDLAREMVFKHANLKTLQNKKRLGKGRAIKNACKTAKGEIVIFSDVNPIIDESFIKNLLTKNTDDYDICIASRLLPTSDVKRSRIRHLFSFSYSLLVRLLFNTRIRDFQCGFKAFKRTVIPHIIKVKNDEWFWDTEMLISAERKGFKIFEIPVRWVEKGPSKYKLLENSLYMMKNLIKLRLRYV
jgi:hypothetical protein